MLQQQATTLHPTVDAVLDSLPGRFNAEYCQNLDAVYQWKLNRPDRHFHIHVKNGQFYLHHGEHSAPHVLIQCSSEIYLQLANKQLKEVIAVITGKLSMKGSISTAQRLHKIFA